MNKLPAAVCITPPPPPTTKKRLLCTELRSICVMILCLHICRYRSSRSTCSHILAAKTILPTPKFLRSVRSMEDNKVQYTKKFLVIPSFLELEKDSNCTHAGLELLDKTVKEMFTESFQVVM